MVLIFQVCRYLLIVILILVAMFYYILKCSSNTHFANYSNFFRYRQVIRYGICALLNVLQNCCDFFGDIAYLIDFNTFVATVMQCRSVLQFYLKNFVWFKISVLLFAVVFVGSCRPNCFVLF